MVFFIRLEKLNPHVLAFKNSCTGTGKRKARASRVLEGECNLCRNQPRAQRTLKAYARDEIKVVYGEATFASPSVRPPLCLQTIHSRNHLADVTGHIISGNLNISTQHDLFK